MKKESQTPNLFETLGFNEDEALKILKEAKAKAEKETAKSSLVEKVSDGIIFTQAKDSPLNTNGYWNDKPEIYSLHYVYTKNGKNGKTFDVTAENKNKSFFMELAKMAKGSKLAEVINSVLQTTTATAPATK